MVVYTVGHSNVDVEEVVKLLEQCGIEMVLNVHSYPYGPVSACSIS